MSLLRGIGTRNADSRLIEFGFYTTADDIGTRAENSENNTLRSLLYFRGSEVPDNLEQDCFNP